jgi:hypothetical protein
MSSRTDLEKKITATLAGDAATFEQIADLVVDVEDAVAAAEATAKLENERALDPTMSADPADARAAAEDATIAAGRLRTMLPRLQARLAGVQARERLARWRASYEALRVERDALAAELREVYPAAVARLVDLLGRITINDVAIGKLHLARPSGVSSHLRTAEQAARDIDGFCASAPSITKLLQLPDFRDSANLAFPPRSSFAGAYAAAARAPAPHGGADWWKDGDARAAEQAAESERVAGYYAEQARSRAEREATEERARAAEARR